MRRIALKTGPGLGGGVCLLPATATGLAQLGVDVAVAFGPGAESDADSGAASAGHIGVLPCGRQEGDLVD